MKPSNIHLIPPDSRPDIREELARRGIHQLNDSHLVALILRSGNSSLGVEKLAQQLIEQAGLQGLARIDLEELQAFKGLGPAKAASLAAAFELGRRANLRQEVAVCTSEQAAGWFQDLALAHKECVRALYLDSRRQVLKVETVSVGTLTQALVHPREVFQPAILCNAASVIVGHNHPSGDPTPSLEDFAVTERLAKAGRLLGLELVDHIIVARSGYRSLKALGRLPSGSDEDLGWAC